MRARQDDLRRARGLVDVEHEGLDAVAGAVRLRGHLLAARQDRLGAVEVHDDVALLEAPDDARDELALAVLELVERELALGVADLLDDDLLGRLRRDAAERVGRHVEAEAERVADEHLGVDVDGFLERDLLLRVLDRLDDGLVLVDVDLSGVVVVLRLDVAVHAEHPTRRGLDGRLHDLDDRVARDVLLVVDRVDQLRELAGDHASSWTSPATGGSWASACPGIGGRPSARFW